MEKILNGPELKEAQGWLQAAVEEAGKSPCKRDKRGAVIVDSIGLEIGSGFNAPPAGLECEPRHCEPTCKDYAVHAEMNAIANAVRRGNGQKLFNATMYHARTERGILQKSRSPKCYQCSKHLVVFGISGFVLNREGGCTYYPIEDFNRLSLESLEARS
ncbi:MAG: hypothetical protein KJ600_00370 [Nanoarchaeota archaeon]|nr:hypothetical protein [Nanoarchaeota archaeon]MBU1102999.1 hypothetical protein [Nanoarchaeota archaeon]